MYIRGDKLIFDTTPLSVLLVLRRKPLTPLDSYSPQGPGRRQYRQKMPQLCSVSIPEHNRKSWKRWLCEYRTRSVF